MALVACDTQTEPQVQGPKARDLMPDKLLAGCPFFAVLLHCSCPAASSVDLNTPPSAHAQPDNLRPSSSGGGAGSSRPAGSSSNPDDDGALQVSVVWQEKTPTRIPEALWFSFRPAGSAVDASSWRLHKLGSSIHPHEVSWQLR